MIPPQAAAKAHTVSRETDQAGTCAEKCIQLKMLERASCGQDRLQDKEPCTHVREFFCGQTVSTCGSSSVVVCAAFDLTVSEAKTEVMCIRTKGRSESSAIFTVEAASQVYNQTSESVYLGGNVNHNNHLSIEIDRRIRKAWCSTESTLSNCMTDRALPLSSNCGC